MVDPVGLQIPTLPALAQEFGVALITVRQAVRVLKEEGLLLPEQGRGTFVRGKPQTHPKMRVESSLPALADLYRKHTPLRLRDDIADVSNLDHTGGIWGADSRLRMFQLANRMWHTDSSFKHTPALCSLLYARTIPPLGGHTEFCDLRAAWDALDDATKARIDGLVAEHAIHHSRARYGYDRFTEDERQAMPAVPQVLVRTIPQAGRRSLYLASHAGRILGMDNPAGLELIDGLIRHATADRRFVHQHRWRVGDLVMWDDRCTMHRGTDFDDLRWPRDVQRATVADVANTCEQEGVSVAAE